MSDPIIALRRHIADATSEPPPVEQVRARARRHRRRQMIPGVAAIVVVTAVVATAVAVTGASPTQQAKGGKTSPPARTAPTALAATLGVGSAVSTADVLTLQMFTVDDGVAVACVPAAVSRSCFTWPPAHGRDYLVATRDGGTSWTVTGPLPASVHPEQSYDVQVAFSTPSAGYVQSTDPDATLFTSDAGRTWSALRTDGRPKAISLEGQALWIISDFCPATTPYPLCPSRLLTYAPGHLAPTSELPIPTEGIAAAPGISATTREATLLDRLGPSSAVVEEGSEGSPTSLLLTSDSGRHWTVLRDPCGRITPTGLVAPAPSLWIIYCQLDGGMHQGWTRLYSTDEEGTSWTLVAEGNVEGHELGNIGAGVSNDLTLSGDGRILWLLGSVSGISSSTDGGFDWSFARVETDGDFSHLAVAGATSAWLPLPGIGLYRTTNGTTWSKLK